MADGYDCDYIVVGSGAGGGTLAARLAEEGQHVILLEAGGDPRTEGGFDRFPGDYDIPAFHAFASENKATAWSFFVEHYADPAQQARDKKRTQGKGVLYPRAGTLGGCTAHNAMIFITPQPCDWDDTAKRTGDPGWSNDAMEKYQHRVENCQHRPVWRWLSKLGRKDTGHGWEGWLNVATGQPKEALWTRSCVGFWKPRRSPRARASRLCPPGSAACSPGRSTPTTSGSTAMRGCATRRSPPRIIAESAPATACSTSPSAIPTSSRSGSTPW